MTPIFKKIYDEPPFDEKEILRYAGCATPENGVAAIMRSCIDEVCGKLVYKVCYAEFPIHMSNGICDLTFTKTASADLMKNLSGCDRIILFGATIGIQIDRLIAKYSVLSPSKALFFQAIGAERIEALCNIFCDELKKSYAVKPRFSPGYGDLSIYIQRDIFDALCCHKNIGLSLNDSLLMSPSKSVTAIVGIKTEGKN